MPYSFRTHGTISGDPAPASAVRGRFAAQKVTWSRSQNQVLQAYAFVGGLPFAGIAAFCAKSAASRSPVEDGLRRLVPEPRGPRVARRVRLAAAEEPPIARLAAVCLRDKEQSDPVGPPRRSTTSSPAKRWGDSGSVRRFRLPGWSAVAPITAPGDPRSMAR